MKDSRLVKGMSPSQHRKLLITRISLFEIMTSTICALSLSINGFILKTLKIDVDRSKKKEDNYALLSFKFKLVICIIYCK